MDSVVDVAPVQGSLQMDGLRYVQLAHPILQTPETCKNGQSPREHHISAVTR